MVEKAQPLDESFAKLSSRVERIQVEVVVLDRPPQTFDEDVVLASAAAVHADSDFVVFENLGEPVAGKLCSLIRVEDFRSRERRFGTVPEAAAG